MELDYAAIFEDDGVANIAKICHQANKALCETIGDYSQQNWEDAPEWQKQSAISGVLFHLGGNHAPMDSHNKWMQDKIADGWIFGELKSAELKTHPCLKPFVELEPENQMKDFLFSAIVKSFKQMLNSENIL
jgi:hypothetical protein